MNDGQMSEQRLWYALRVTYNRELKLKEDLELRGIECFVPMKVSKRERDGVLERKWVPSVHNLVFAHCAPAVMRDYKQATTLPVRYIMNRAEHKPLIVPDRQMESFMAVAKSGNEDIVYLTPKAGDFARGDRVRVVGGVFKGAEGVFVRVKGDRRVVVSIEGLVAVATTFIHPSMLEKID